MARVVGSRKPITHGTAHGYTYYRCRCSLCTDAFRKTAATCKSNRRNRPFEDIPHGTASGYSNYGCKCRDCLHARWAKLYNVSIEQLTELYENQSGRCAICGIAFDETTLRQCVDHDHETGKVRGFLCGKCNCGIGQFDDDPALLTKAIEYIEERNAA